MGPISLRVHNIFDYIIGVALIISPGIFGFFEIEPARNVFVTLGGGLIGYSLFTKYRYSIVKLIPLGLHMTLDVLSGLVLMTAPWLFDYRAFLTGGHLTVHFIFGLGAIGLVALTRSRTERAKASEPVEDRESRRAA